MPHKIWGYKGHDFEEINGKYYLDYICKKCGAACSKSARHDYESVSMLQLNTCEEQIMENVLKNG